MACDFPPTNGLNQLTSVGPKALTHDLRGNVTAFGTKAFTYSSENLLATGPNGTTLAYDPMARLQQIVSGGATTKLAYDGLDRIAEFDGSSTLLRRYVHGPNVDEPLVWYEGSGTADRRFMSSDERGSIISVTDSAGTLLGLNRYDEYGMPQATNLGAFGYTGQAWLPTIGLWYYKARVYEPELGRFLQADPIGFAGGINIYAYVGNDPVNLVDPLGLVEDIVVTGPAFCVRNAAQCARTAAREAARITRELQQRVESLRERAQPEREMGEREKSKLSDHCTRSPEGTPMGDSFAEACKGHDECFGSVGAIRAECDRQFLNDMLKVCPGSTHPFLCQQYALRYYLVVRRIGGLFFWYEQKRQRGGGGW